jgi:N-acetyl-gamma-glutamyl-phosphate reductase
MTISRRLFIGTGIAGSAALASGLVSSTAWAASPVAVGILIPGSKSDKGWMESGYDGLTASENKHGAAIKVQMIENIKDAEMEQALTDIAGDSVEVIFTPHLIPMDRGIFTTAYAVPRRPLNDAQLLELYRDYFADKPFVRVRESLPTTKDSAGTNYLDIAVRSVRSRVVVLACEDNLVRGASGVAVQNFNRMFGFDERSALL